MPTIGRLFFEIGGDTSRLQDSLRQAMASLEQAGIKATRAGQATIAAFDAALNPTKALAEQIKLLESAGRSTGDILAVMGGKIKSATEQAILHKQPVDSLVQKYADLAGEGRKTGISIESLGKAVQDFARNPVEAAKSGVGSLLQSLGPTATGIGTVATAAAAAGVAIFKMAEGAAETAVSLRNMSILSGLSAQDMQVMQRMGEEAGLENENLAKILAQLNRELATGQRADFIKVLNALRLQAGQTSADLSKGIVPLLDDLQEHLNAIEDPMKRAEMLNAAFNRRQTDLAILLTVNKEKFSDQLETLKKQGLAWDDLTQHKALQLHERLEMLSRDWAGLGVAMKSAWVFLAERATRGLELPQPQIPPEEIARQEMEQLNGKIQFPAGPFTEVITPEEDAIKTAERRIAMAKAVAAGYKEHLDLIIAIADKEKQFSEAAEINDAKRAEALAPEIAAMKRLLKNYEEFPKTLEQWQKAYDETLKIQEEINKKGHAALVPGKGEIEQSLKKLETETLERLKTFQQVEASLAKDTTNSKLEELRLQKKLAETLVPMNEAERSRIEMEKIHLQFAIKAEETRVKYTQLRADITSQINKLDPTDPFRIQALQDMEVLTQRMNKELETLGKLEGAEVLKVHRQEYLKMIDSVRDGAGKVFDAISSRGRGAFQSLLDWIEGVFLTRLRVLFQNLVETLFVPNVQGQGILARLTQGVFPQIGATQAAGISSSGSLGFLASLPGFAGPLAGIAGGIGLMTGLNLSGGAWAQGAAGIGAGILGGAGAISTGLIPGIGSAGLMSSLGFMATNPITLALAGALFGGIGISKMIGAIQGKSAETAGAMEVSRDLGGIPMGKDQFAQFYQSVGLSESQAYGIRKDLMSSPLFLTTVAAPLAEAQGKMEDFLKSLESVKTSWGTFNFREAFETGQSTGDWSELNKEFKEAFAASQALKEAMPDWQTKLMGVEDATKHVKTAAELLTDSITGLRDSISSSLTPLKDMYQKFLETGEITEEFSSKITELGGDIDKFKKLADLSKVNSDFQTMAQHFRETGEILPGLRDLFEQFGGDLGALDAAAAIPGLKDSLSLIASLRQELSSFLPEMTPVQKIMAGEMDQSVMDALQSAGIDPEKMQKITGVMKLESGWDQAVQQFQQTGKLAKGGILEQALQQYGGTAGQTAVERSGQGFNTITDQLLASTKAALDAAYRADRTEVLDVLDKAQQETTEKITSLTESVENQFTIVGQNITDSLNSAKSEVVDVLNQILDRLSTATTVVVASPSEVTEADPGEIPGLERGGWVERTGLAVVHEGEVVGRPGNQGSYIDLRGATIYGWDDFDRKVAEAQARNARRSGLSLAMA